MRNDINYNKSSQQSFGLAVTDSARVRSFFWQPWFSKITGILSATVIDYHARSSMSPTYNSVNTYINGDLGLNLVEKSRFPFEGHIYRRDNRYNNSLLDSSFVTLLTGYSLTSPTRSSNGQSPRWHGWCTTTTWNRRPIRGWWGCLHTRCLLRAR